MEAKTKAAVDRISDEIWAELKQDALKLSIAGKITECKMHYHLKDEALAGLLHCGIGTVSRAEGKNTGLPDYAVKRLNDLHRAIHRDGTT